MDDIALALCGGGGKGAFHIGVWKALEEHGILKNVKAISGTSVGALNAVLFALKDFNYAKRIWYNIDNSVLLTPKKKESAEMRLDDGFFSRDGLEAILKSISLEQLQTSDIAVFVTLYDVKAKKPSYFRINDLCKDDMITVLLATSAIPFVYSPVMYKGVEYIDGGVTEFGNVPIEPLYAQGFKNIYILSLDYTFNINAINGPALSGPISATNYYPGCNFIPIQPLTDLGATLSFGQGIIRSRMIAGYSAANKILSGEKVYYMKNQYSALNTEIRRKMTTLFKSAKELEEFISVSNFGEANIKMATMGGTVWYENIVEIFGWKVQQHKVVGLTGHYRILDNNNIRRAWVLNPEDLLHALEEYEAQMKFQND